MSWYLIMKFHSLLFTNPGYLVSVDVHDPLDGNMPCKQTDGASLYHDEAIGCRGRLVGMCVRLNCALLLSLCAFRFLL